MSAKFYTLLTDIGAAKLANAAALGVPLKITQMAVGDGGGVLPTPNAQQTKLVGEKRRAALNMLYIDPQNSSQVIAEQVIRETALTSCRANITACVSRCSVSVLRSMRPGWIPKS